MKSGAVVKSRITNDVSVSRQLLFRAMIVTIFSIALLTPIAKLHSAPPGEFVPEKDFIIAAVDAGFKEMLKDFEITESMERDLIVVAYRGQFKGTSVLSITLIRPGKENGKSDRRFHKNFNEQFTLRMAKITSTKVESPIAVINSSVLVDGRVAVEQRVFLWDENHWGEVSRAGMPLQRRRCKGQ